MTGTGHTSDETRDEPQHDHSDAESLRRIPADYDDRGVVQDSPGNPDIGVEHGEPNRQRDPENDNTNDG
ncbi:hypothetical protein [Deinococcus xianganensis]|uniref:Uncharacterized protein n=1 Tax=Deinococcus xianganensis TaxID=1507289 RepID=A0A6I4YBY7_9DEIO|nr:hypothetical protein [Deinococcus xianganensis]MXV18538.1 hypothetical protein [Deinococcus xianganensis]